jgi:hypothetical protein
VKLPNATTPLCDYIHDNPKLYPFFKDCLGAVDGTQIAANPPTEDAPRYRNRKGGITQNVLVATDFTMKILYILPGWEGSAADGRVWEAARRKDFTIPEGKYYLGDAGFPTCASLLVPYRGVRYHLREWLHVRQQ